MRIEVGDERVPVYLDRASGRSEHPVTVVGHGRHVGKAAWVALVLEDEHGYQQTAVNLDRVVNAEDADLARLRIRLEAEAKRGDATERHERNH